MPQFHLLAVAVLFLMPPLLSILLINYDTQIRPHCRTVRAVSSGILLNVAIWGGLAGVGVVIEGQSIPILPLLLFALIVVGIRRVVILEQQSQLC